MSDNFFEVKDLNIEYKINKKTKKIIDSISFKIGQGETFGLIGESGSGKTTIGKAIMQLIPIQNGTIKLEGEKISSFMPYKMQMIFQNPYGSVNPCLKVSEIIREPLLIQKKDDKKKVEELLDLTELSKSILDKYPKELSGGQLQRIGIARALILNPKFIFCDEPTSSLDSYHEQKIVELLINLQKEKNLTYLWVTHNLPLISQISKNIGILHSGKMIEMGLTKDILQNSKHYYTKLLISSIPIPDPILEKKRKNLSFNLL